MFPATDLRSVMNQNTKNFFINKKYRSIKYQPFEFFDSFYF